MHYEKGYFNWKTIEVLSAYKYMDQFNAPNLIWSYAKHNLAVQARKSIFNVKVTELRWLFWIFRII